MTVASFMAQLGYAPKLVGSFQRLGGVYAPCRLHANGELRYHEEQLHLIDCVGKGVMSEEEAQAAWKKYCIDSTHQHLALKKLPEPPPVVCQI